MVLVLGGKSKSSSKVTHCLVCFPAWGGGWRRGAKAGGREEGGARGKDGVGEGSVGRGSSRGADDGPNRDVVLWSWEVGAGMGACVGISGCVNADIVL